MATGCAFRWSPPRVSKTGDLGSIGSSRYLVKIQKHSRFLPTPFIACLSKTSHIAYRLRRVKNHGLCILCRDHSVSHRGLCRRGHQISTFGSIANAMGHQRETDMVRTSRHRTCIYAGTGDVRDRFRYSPVTACQFGFSRRRRCVSCRSPASPLVGSSPFNANLNVGSVCEAEFRSR